MSGKKLWYTWSFLITSVYKSISVGSQFGKYKLKLYFFFCIFTAFTKTQHNKNMIICFCYKKHVKIYFIFYLRWNYYRKQDETSPPSYPFSLSLNSPNNRPKYPTDQLTGCFEYHGVLVYDLTTRRPQCQYLTRLVANNCSRKVYTTFTSLKQGLLFES